MKRCSRASQQHRRQTRRLDRTYNVRTSSSSMRIARDLKRGRLGVRASDRQRALLTAASELEGTTVSDFVLKHATRAAEEVLADRRLFVISAAAWARFDTMLRRQPRTVRGLRELLTTKTLLDQP